VKKSQRVSVYLNFWIGLRIESVLMEVSFQIERADWVFIIPASVIWIIALFVTAWDFVQLQGMIYRFSIVGAFGLVLFLIGVSMRRVAKRTLGKYYTYGLKTLEKYELVKHGIYKHVRHPIYLAMLLYNNGITLFFSSLYGFLFMQAFIPLIIYRVKIEENMLIKKFGDEYREYMKETKKLIPFIY